MPSETGMPFRPGVGDPGSHIRQRARVRISAVVTVALMLVAGLTMAVRGDEEERDLNANSHRTGPVTPAEDLDGLRRHFRARNVSDLSEQDIKSIYAGLKKELARRYARSEEASVTGYQRWTRYNRVPFLSSAHGNRYVNTFANDAGKAYGLYEKAGILPVGSVLAKDTFTVSEDGTVRPGPLMVMEKMPEGFNYASGDWRYVAIMPDGSILGETNGDASESVEFCIACHLVMEHLDHLHFIPEEYRAR